MARREHHKSVRFDGRTSTALTRASQREDRTLSQQIQRYVRRGLTADGYWDESQVASEGGTAAPEPEDPSSSE